LTLSIKYGYVEAYPVKIILLDNFKSYIPHVLNVILADLLRC